MNCGARLCDQATDDADSCCNCYGRAASLRFLERRKVMYIGGGVVTVVVILVILVLLHVI
jgi:hypothetical protein